MKLSEVKKILPNLENVVTDANGTVIDLYQETGLATDFQAKKFDRLRTAIKISILWSTIFCVIVGVGFGFKGILFFFYQSHERFQSHTMYQIF